MVFSAVTGVNTHVAVTDTPKQETIVKDESMQKKETEKRIATEAYVRDYFSDLPIMSEIAYCESRFRQFDKNGEVFRGEVNVQDVGVMQINEHYHLDTATSGNYNLYTLAGNVAYARKLYEKFGTAPWGSSKPCWGKKVALLADAN